MNITTVTTKGQATIPEEIRSILEIKPGDRISYSNPDPVRKRATIEVISSKDAVDELYGSLNPDKKIKYIPLGVARKRAGAMLAKKYGLKKADAKPSNN